MLAKRATFSQPMNHVAASVHLDVPSLVVKSNAFVQLDLSCPLPEGLNVLVCGIIVLRLCSIEAH